MSELHQSTDFTGKSALRYKLLDDVFRYCTFDGLDVEGNGFEGIAVACTFRNSSWYWGLFNTAVFVDVLFVDCVFRGTGFAGCTFTRCQFVNCKFVKDNLNGDCRFDDCSWYDCEQTDCEGLPLSFVPRIKGR